MKQIFTLLPILLLVLAGQFRSLKPEVATNVYARTGSRGASCSGSGICSITTGSGQASLQSGYKATLGYDAQGRVFLEFKYADLPTGLSATPFNTDVFEMKSDCPVPADVLQALHSAETEIMLKSGFYPLNKTSEAVRITFD